MEEIACTKAQSFETQVQRSVLGKLPLIQTHFNSAKGEGLVIWCEIEEEEIVPHSFYGGLLNNFKATWGN